MVTSENPGGIHPLAGLFFFPIKEVSYSEQYWVAYFDGSKYGNVSPWMVVVAGSWCAGKANLHQG